MVLQDDLFSIFCFSFIMGVASHTYEHMHRTKEIFIFHVYSLRVLTLFLESILVSNFPSVCPTLDRRRQSSMAR